MERKEESILRKPEAGDHLPYLPEALREEFLQRIFICLSTVRWYDGTEAARQQLLLQLRQFEEWQFAHFAKYFQEEGQPRLSEATEEALLRHYYPKVIPSFRTISGLLAYTTERFLKRIQLENEAFIETKAQHLDGTILPTGPGEKHEDEGKGNEFTREAVFSPRVRLLLGALQERDIHLDDVLLWVGDVPKDALKRQYPYVILEIPRLQGRQVLLCDQTGEATFVVVRPIDKKELLQTAKTELKERFGSDLQKVEWRGEEAWKDQVMHTLFLDVKPGEKVDIALREDIRREIRDTFLPEELVKPDGTFSIGNREKTGLDPFMIKGRKSIAIMSLFGISLGATSKRRTPAYIEFLREIFPGDAYLKPILERLERDWLLQHKLGTDGDAWAGFIRGDAVEIEYRGGQKELVRAEEPIPDRKTLQALSWDQILVKREYAGLRPVTYMEFLLTPEDRASWEKIGAHDTSRLAQRIFEKRLFGEEIEGIDDAIRKEVDTRLLQQALGTDVTLWRKYLLGEDILVDGKNVRLETVYPDVDSFLQMTRKQLADFRPAGRGLVFLYGIFSPLEPSIRGKTPKNDELIFHVLARGIYGSSPALEQKIREIRLNRLALKALGHDATKWRDFMKGKVLPLKLDGEQVEYQTTTALPTAASLVKKGSAFHQKIKFAGIGLNNSLFEKVFKSERGARGTWNPPNVLADVERLAFAIYGNERIDDEWLQDRVRTYNIQEAAQEKLGRTGANWRSFIQGESLSITLGQETIQVVSEYIFKDKTGLLKLPVKKRRDLRFAGLGLTALATRIGLPKKMSPYTSPGYETLLGLIFDAQD